jgi:hypothetical protein
MGILLKNAKVKKVLKASEQVYQEDNSFWSPQVHSYYQSTAVSLEYRNKVEEVVCFCIFHNQFSPWVSNGLHGVNLTLLLSFLYLNHSICHAICLSGKVDELQGFVQMQREERYVGDNRCSM